MNLSETISFKCYVCDNITEFYSENVFIQTSRHTHTPVFKFLEKLVGQTISKRNEGDVLCQLCLDKIDEYDKAIVTAERVAAELVQLFSNTLNKYANLVYDNQDQPKFIINSEIKDNVSTGSNESDNIFLDETVDDPSYIENHIENPYPVAIIEKRRVGRPRKKIDKAVSNNYYLINDDCVPLKKKKRKHIRHEKRSYHKYLGPPFKCEKCDIKFENKFDFKMHIKTHDGSDKQVCDVCGQTYKSKAALDIHVGLHKGISPHECDVCGKKFTQKGALVRHMPIHTGERPYQCDKCGKQFIHYSSFHMHQLAHDNIRDKKCSVCGLELRSNSHLTRHMRVHSGEKPYSCPTCGQKFAQRYNMMTHFKAHQGIHRVNTKVHVCPICQVGFPKQAKLNEHLNVQHSSWASSTPTGAKKSDKIAKPHNVQDSADIVSSQLDISSHNLSSLPNNEHNNHIDPGLSVSLPTATITIPISSFLLPLNTEILQIKKETHFLANA